MTQYKLTYFDFDGGRAEPARIAFHAGGIPFEDHRFSFEEFGAVRAGLRFNAVPVLEIDGAQITQSNAISRYIGKLTDLYPADSMQALYCDEVLDVMEDIGHAIGPTFGMQGDEQRLAREKLVEGPLPLYLRGLDALLTRGGGAYFACNQLTVADLKVFVDIRWLSGGFLDHVPTDLVQKVAPGIAAHQQRIAAEPRVVAYYASRA